MPLPPFRTSSGFLISQLGVLATRSWFELLTRQRLTPHQHAVLLTLHAAGPLPMTALANETLVDPRNLGPILEPLEKRDLVERVDDPGDRRRRLMTLTPSGVAAAAELARAADGIEDELLAPLSTSERDVLNAHLLSVWTHARTSSASDSS